ncbi:helicase-related protein [Streptomyces sp. NPDC096095]|uniref:helicase-related protein n=1 Tax=Streptomyces sp. NPDC096095 TaxID=3155545 RepID=UPI00332165BC
MTDGTSTHAAHYALREGLVEQLRRDLLGPGSADEILTQDPPITTYPIGVLFPRASDPESERALQEDAAENEGLDDAPLVRRGRDAEDPLPDLGAAHVGDRRPSSMGLTFAVDPVAAPRLLVHTEVAAYDPVDAEGRPVAAERAEARTVSEQKERWRRRELSIRPVTVDVTVPRRYRLDDIRQDRSTHDSTEGPALDVVVRPKAPASGTVTVTITLINTHRVGKYAFQDAFCLYQPRLTVTTESGAPGLVDRPSERTVIDPEVATSRLLHRHAPTFAVGHGCSADWDWVPPRIGAPNTDRAAITTVRTEFVPAHEVLLTDSNPDIDDSALTMEGLATRPESEVLAALNELMAGYAEWIDRKEAEAGGFRGTPHEAPARTQIEHCGAALARMRRGIRVLGTNSDAMRAFRLANRAMSQQRGRSEWVKNGREGDPDTSASRWRPFQISFMLLCLEGIVDPEHDDRRIADLLWFPTGGGKTEAYLGLIAFTTFLRRMRHQERGGGVTVLMRYTLRLLTLQQFERAASLICAMERIRLGDERTLGTEPISIGMWVGQSATPNTLSVAEESLVELRKEKELQERNPVQLHACPWCGTRIDAYQYEVDEEAKRMYVRCPDTWCDFRDGLPVHLIDEAVYDARPTLVIATVDKFAAMPWREQTAALFNRDREDGTPPPELIVQDELHLISGPLGTLTGLYETAVDLLADEPKIIASTATIRRASEQGSSLFARRVAQFPPAGIDARDSWFAVETPKERKASRQYIGLLTPSTSQSTLLIRTYANLLHRSAQGEDDDQVRDAYWTLVGYFNSLRLLAAAELQVHDDVEAHLGYLADRDGNVRRKILEQTELTSRANSSEVPKRLKQVEQRLGHPDVVDVLLATNMISVGVDVDRLGLMAVMGQPQTTAEYIQATSRVGRRHPGLVAVMLNSNRSRDRSHYESFQHFHSALYREVEPTSVTPFSSRSRERGLHAVVVALARIMIPAARPNDAAGRIDEFRDELDRIVRTTLLARVEKVDREEKEATADAYDEFVEWWSDLAASRGGLLYEPKRGRRTPSLLCGFDDDPDGNAWQTLWSLRDVDAESGLFMEATR